LNGLGKHLKSNDIVQYEGEYSNSFKHG